MDQSKIEEREERAIRLIFAITTKALQQGALTTDPDQLMKLFRGTELSRKEVYLLAKENKLNWVYDIHMTVSYDEYQANMNHSLAHYLKC